jgi:hypothetical protein
MKVVLAVHVRQALQSLENDIANHVLGEELAAVLHYFENVLIEVLEHKVQ